MSAALGLLLVLKEQKLKNEEEGCPQFSQMMPVHSPREKEHM